MGNPDTSVAQSNPEGNKERRRKLTEEFLSLYNDIHWQIAKDGPLKNKDGTEVGVNDSEQSRTIVLVSILIESGRYDELKISDKVYYYKLSQESRDRLVKATVDALEKAKLRSTQTPTSPSVEPPRVAVDSSAQPNRIPDAGNQSIRADASPSPNQRRRYDRPSPSGRRRLEAASSPVDYSQLGTLEQIVTALKTDSGNVSTEAGITNEQVAATLVKIFNTSINRARRTKKEPSGWNEQAYLVRMGIPTNHPLIGAVTRAFLTEVRDRYIREIGGSGKQSPEIVQGPLEIQIIRANDIVVELGQRGLGSMVRFTNPDGSNSVKIPLETLRAASTSAETIRRGPKVGTAKDINSFQLKLDPRTGLPSELTVSGMDINQNNINYQLRMTGEALTRVLQIISGQDQQRSSNVTPVGGGESSATTSASGKPAAVEKTSNDQGFGVSGVRETGFINKQIVLERQQGQAVKVNKYKLRRAFELKTLYPMLQDQGDFQITLKTDVNGNEITQIVGTDVDGRKFDVLLGNQALKELIKIFGIVEKKENILQTTWDVGREVDVGKVRDHNEDNLEVEVEQNVVEGDPAKIYLLADGMGGHAAGEVASQMAVEMALNYIKQKLPEQRRLAIEACDKYSSAKRNEFINSFMANAAKQIIKDAIIYANRQVYHKRISQGNDMGTTLVATLQIGDFVVSSHIGDSRLMIFDKSGNYQRQRSSRDHSYVQSLIDIGQVSEDERRAHPQKNLITKTIGLESNLQVDDGDIKITKLEPGETAVACSDGLWEMFKNESHIGRTIKQGGSNADIAKRLIKLANEGGGEDNISVIVFGNK